MNDKLPELNGNRVYGEGGADLPPQAVSVGRTVEQLDKLPTIDLTTIEKDDRIIINFNPTGLSAGETITNMVILVVRPPIFDPFNPQRVNALRAKVKVVAGQKAKEDKELLLNGGLVGGALSRVNIANGMPLEMQTPPPPDSQLPGIFTTETIVTPPAAKISLIREGKKYGLKELPKLEPEKQTPDEFNRLVEIIREAEGKTSPYILKAENDEAWFYDAKEQMVVILKKVEGGTVNITVRHNVNPGNLGSLNEPWEEISTAYNISQNPKINGTMGVRIPRGKLQKAGLDLQAGVEVWINQGEIEIRDNIHIQGDRAKARQEIGKIEATVVNGDLVVIFGKTKTVVPGKPDVEKISKIISRVRVFANREKKVEGEK